MALLPTASVTLTDPNFIGGGEGFELSSQTIIPNAEITATFTPFQDSMEVWVYDNNNNIIGGNQNFQNYTLVDSPSNGEEVNGSTSELKLNPSEDARGLGFDTGNLNLIYNFLQPQLGTSTDPSSQLQYYLAEISSDRTELRLKSNFISNDIITSTYYAFKTQLDENNFADEFYLNFGLNQYQVGINCILDTSATNVSVLVKLYDALPPQFSLEDTLSIVTKPAESLAYSVNFPFIDTTPDDFTYIKGPNYKLEVNQFLNNSTNLKSKNELLQTDSSGSLDELQNILNRKGITLTPNYSYNTFNEFVNFSSAQKRIENFVEKVTQIQAYQSDINTLDGIGGETSESFTVSSSIASAYTNIQNLITNFDGYEYFLYYGTGSFSYPKTGSAYPFELLPTTDVSVYVWLGSDVENSQYYGGIQLSASLYDYNNQNWLYYTIPEFIRDNSDNNQYLEFSNMVGQHFDEIWLYTRAITEKLNTTSQLEDGVPLDLADDVITSLGYTGFGNNFNNQDNFIGLTGENNGSYVPPTGSELITNYIAVNNGTIINYWDPNYSWENYVESLEDPGFPYAIDKVSSEIYKRLYHNMNYLVKKKGTIAGLRQLINIWGIPNTILRINEFGGKDRDNSDDYDLWYNRYSYAYTPVSTQNVASSSVVFPWMPLERNHIADEKNIVPDSFQFRFKTTGYPSSSFAGDFFTQSLAVKKSDGDDTSTDFDFGISLFYDPPTTGSYSGSASSEYENWGNMRFYISGSAADGGTIASDNIYLPFFDKGWWTVMLQRDQHVSASDNTNITTYTLYAKNTISNGNDGAQIGFEGSASFISETGAGVNRPSYNEAWNKFGVTAADGIYLGGFISGSTVGGEITGLESKILSGSLQEFRYYSNDIPEATFNDFVMNPESIEGNAVTGSQRSFDIVNFRAPLGNEMESMFTSSYSSSYSESMQSMHPAVQGQAPILITGSFWNPTTSTTSSEYRVLYYENSSLRTFSKTNTEVYFLDQPAIGFRNRISDKIQLRDGDDYGNILSNRISIQQDYQISRSYTENINNLEVAFSPQDEVNDDIIASFGYGVIATAIADPRFVLSPDSYYPKLKEIAASYFEKYTEGNVYDYLRLIKYFDNSIFKAIKSYVPASTNVSTGIVIKQHMLERSRFQPVQITEGTQVATTPSGALNTPIILENIVISGSIDAINQEAPSGSTGGSANKFNYLDSSFLVESGEDQGNPHGTPFGKVVNTQSYKIINDTVLGAVEETIDTQHEFYDGIFSGSEEVVTSQSLFYNPFSKQSNINVQYFTDVINPSPEQTLGFIAGGFNSGLIDIEYFNSGSIAEDNGQITTSPPPTYPLTINNVVATSSNFTADSLTFNIKLLNENQIDTNAIEVVDPGTGWVGTLPTTITFSSESLGSNLAGGVDFELRINENGLPEAGLPKLINTGGIQQYTEGYAYNGASSDKVELANGYRYIPSSSLLIPTASILDIQYLPRTENTIGNGFYTEPTTFNALATQAISPTPYTQAQLMQGSNRPMIVGLWKNRWGYRVVENFIAGVYAEVALERVSESFDAGTGEVFYDYSQYWQLLYSQGIILNEIYESPDEYMGPIEGSPGVADNPITGFNNPSTQSFYVSYTGIPYVNSPSENLAGPSILGRVISSNTVEGVGALALHNPEIINLESYFQQYVYYSKAIGTYGNQETPTLRLNLEKVFPISSSLTSSTYEDSNFGGLDQRIIDTTAIKSRTSIAFYNSGSTNSQIIPSLQKGWTNYVFQLYQTQAESNIGSRPIYQFGQRPTKQSQFATFGNTSWPAGRTIDAPSTGSAPLRELYEQIFLVTDGTDTVWVGTTNTSIGLPYFEEPNPKYRVLGAGMDLYAISYPEIGGVKTFTIQGLYEVLDTSQVLSVVDNFDSLGDTSNLELNPYNGVVRDPDSSTTQQFYMCDFNSNTEDEYGVDMSRYYISLLRPPSPNPMSQGSLGDVAYYCPLPNNNYAFITASWDTAQSFSGTQNDWDVKPIHTTTPPTAGSGIAGNDYMLSNFYGAQQNALIDINRNTPVIGTASLYPFQSTVTGSLSASTLNLIGAFTSSRAVTPTAFSINNQSIDTRDGGTINNGLSFTQPGVNIRFTIDTDGVPNPSLQRQLVPNNVIQTSQLTIDSNPFIEGTYTSLYTAESRVYYGTNPIYGFIDTPTQLYTIDPYIEDTGIGFFENTIYYATPNNFNENRPNKFKYVIENQNGINTVSNLQAIISGSAQQAQTPESNYTMKASTIPRYSGSKVTSADYNFYSAPTPANDELLITGTGSFEIVNSFNATGSSLIATNVKASTTTGIGELAEFTFNLATTQSINSIIVTSGGKNYKPGDALSFTSQSLGSTLPNGSNLTLRLNSNNFKILKPTTFADGTSGSWTGDESYGKTAALDKNPIYFAHFKSSRNNLELDDTYTFSIDQLILAPFNDITNASLTTGPQTIDINGSNNRLLDVVNTFEKGRKASITYQVPIQSYPVLAIPRNAPGESLTQSLAITQSVTTNYQTLKIGDNSIFQAGAEFETLLSTQPDGIGPNFLTSASLTIGQNVSITPFFGNGSVNGKETISYLGTSISSNFQFGKGYWAFASGSDLKGGGYIDLKGGPALLSASLAPGGFASTGYYGGDILAMTHNYNYWVEDQLLSEFTASAGTPTLKFAVPGLPTASSNQSPIQVPSSSLSNYSSFNFSASEAGANILGYEDFDLPFLIQRGDEIRVTYDINFTGSGFEDITKLVQLQSNFRTQDFVVKSIGASNVTDPGYVDTSPSMVFNNGSVSASISESRMFDRLFVEPNPATLSEPIPNGQVFQFTVRRKINADDRIIIYQTPPINALGSQTPTRDGYLIPNDFTQTQKKNVQTLINQLKSQNAVNTSTTAQQSPNQNS